MNRKHEGTNEITANEDEKFSKAVKEFENQIEEKFTALEIKKLGYTPQTVKVEETFNNISGQEANRSGNNSSNNSVTSMPPNG